MPTRVPAISGSLRGVSHNTRLPRAAAEMLPLAVASAHTAFVPDGRVGDPDLVARPEGILGELLAGTDQSRRAA